jgi:glutamate N-acetyltransferase/amino-acid N-acetyltransferase
VADLSASHWSTGAEGIMTTDTRPKLSSRQIRINGKTVTITGMAKGSGMIKPDMATMLAYVATDARVSKPVLNKLLKEMVNISFNRITVDGDTSTNDACLLMASGKADQPLIRSAQQREYGRLKKALTEVFTELAQAIIRDAEGATKFITLEVSGGKTEKECLQVAYAVAESPLVKTAFFASDPNWGRIVAAIGRSGVRGLDVNKVKLYLGDLLLAEKGGRAASYSEQAGQRVMNQSEIQIRIHLGRGSARQVVWTSDLSHEYIRINAEYRS